MVNTNTGISQLVKFDESTNRFEPLLEVENKNAVKKAAEKKKAVKKRIETQEEVKVAKQDTKGPARAA